MADLIENREILSSVRAKLNATINPYPTRAAFEAATIPSAVSLVYAIEAGDVYQLVRDATGTWTAGDSSKWAATIASGISYGLMVTAQEAAEAAAAQAASYGSRFTETDAEMASIVIDPDVTFIARVCDTAGQVAPEGQLSWWVRNATPGTDPYFTTSGGVTWTETGLRSQDVLAAINSAIANLGTEGQRIYATRAAAVSALSAGVPATVTRVGWHHNSDTIFVTKVSGATDWTVAGWLPDGEILSAHYGAAEDYTDTTDTGTDDLAAINAATAYAATIGEHVWIAGPSLVSGPVVIPDGCRGLKAKIPVGSSVDQTGAPAWPSGYPLGSALIGSSASGPVLHLKYSDQHAHDLEIGATAARYAASISTGSGNVNCGILIEPPDTSGAIIARVGHSNCLMRNQPADGWLASGNVASLTVEHDTEINCKRHGFNIDNGANTGRTNKARPGIVTVRNPRGINLGGHAFKIGDAGESTNQPYRVLLEQTEPFRCGNVSGNLIVSSCAYILAEQVVIIASAANATSGTSGSTPTLDHSWSVGGKEVTFIGSRSLGYVAEPINLLASPWSGTGNDMETVRILGMHCANESAPDPVNMIKHNGLAYDLFVDNVSGNFSGYPIDLSTFVGTATVDYNGTLALHGKIFEVNKMVLGQGSTLTIASGAVTVTSSFHRIDTEGAAATDDLDTINGGEIGMRLVIKTATSARDVVVKATGGNIRLSADVTLNNSFDTFELIYDGTYWTSVSSFGNNGA